jgi:hypothetical protein
MKTEKITFRGFIIVRYSKPAKGEESFRFILLELNDNRASIQLVCHWTIKPVETVDVQEICPA